MVEEQNIQIPWSTISKRIGKRSRLSISKMAKNGWTAVGVGRSAAPEAAQNQCQRQGAPSNGRRQAPKEWRVAVTTGRVGRRR
jgi:hypothetical protein